VSGRRRHPPLIVVASALVLLSSCAPASPEAAPPEDSAGGDSIAVDRFLTEDSDLAPPPEGRTNAVLETSSAPPLLTVTMWGSSSCVDVPVDIVWKDSSTLSVSMGPSGSRECTADLTAVSQVIEVPTDHPATDVTTVEVDAEPVRFVRAG